LRTNIQSPLVETAAGAIAEHVLRACVHCGMCNATCPTYQITGDELDGPRGRIYLIKAALEGAPVGRATQLHLDRCLSCRACETTCPSGVEYHRLFDVGREVVAARVSRSWYHRHKRNAVRLIAGSPKTLRAFLGVARAFRFVLPAVLARKLPQRVAAGALPKVGRGRRMSVLGGCVQSVTAPHFNAATARVFDRAGIALAATEDVSCCGALAFHLEAPEAARATVRRNIDAWIAALDGGAEAIVVNASGCAAFIRDYPDVMADDPQYAEQAERVAGAVIDPIEVLQTAALEATAAPRQSRIAVHEPCTLRNGPGLNGAIGKLLTRLGYEVQPTRDAHLCCGSAGAYSLLQPRFAGRLRADKIAALMMHGPEAVYTANIGCWLHLNETSPVPVRHWIEAVDDVLAAD
jgi:glycolate oxidase iron-sulfur subunit